MEGCRAVNPEIRAITAEELSDYVQLDAYAFGYETTPEAIDRFRTRYHLPHLLAAFVRGRMVAHLAILRFGMTLNGRLLPMAGVADVSAWPEDRRAGHTGRLLRAALARMRDDGMPLSMLYPTFSALYRRFGWALASEGRAYSFRPAELQFLPGASTADGGRLERLPVESGLETAATVYDRLLPAANGAIARGEAEWAGRREAQPALQLVIWRDASDSPQGYMLHRHPLRIPDAPAFYDQRMDVRELVALSPAAYRALVGYLARHDLVTRTHWLAPPDDPLHALLADPSVVTAAVRPGFMLRIVDLAPALESRPYLPGPPARLVLGVRDTTAPWNDGTWALTVEDGAARVTRTTDAPELSTDAATLAALYNGFLCPERARAAGLIDVRDVATLTAAARLFAVSRAPHCYDHF